ncbi:DsbA family protein [Rhizobium halophytocola]|uniref:Protein-disulfide isomerase n=1 Tax=Rhizobium halophytocola TaxID=735519 RepID=A0ABS4DTY6_9HYPH|nr:DsbA family protein [Rhizobium halophytocola]MBP1849153.1 protein-disulfide isomerase [Rhizobium halophytocola]
MITRRTLMTAGAGVALTSLIGPGLANAADQPSPEEVFSDKDMPVLGNPDGDVTMVEYFDYQCGYCKQTHPDVMKVVESDGNVRLLMKDWPVFGANSVYAAQAVLGAAEIGKYREAQEALMRARGQLTPQETQRLLVRAGVDMQAVTAAVNKNSKKIGRLLDRNYRQAVGLDFRGTPSFVIGTKLYPGAMDVAELKSAIARARG